MSRKTKKRSSVPKPNRFLWLTGLIGGGLVLIWVLWSLAQSSPAPVVPVEVQGVPKLKVEQAKIDLGNVKLGQTVSASFKVSNVGDRPLQFSEAPYIEVIEGC